MVGYIYWTLVKCHGIKSVIWDANILIAFALASLGLATHIETEGLEGVWAYQNCLEKPPISRPPLDHHIACFDSL